MTALNPVFTIGNQIAESLRLHQALRGAGLKRRTIDLLGRLRIPAPPRGCTRIRTCSAAACGSGSSEP